MKDLLQILKYLKYLLFLPILNLVLVTDLVVQKLTPSKIIKGHCGSAVKQLQIQNYGQKNTTFEKVQNKGVVIARARAEKRWHLRCNDLMFLTRFAPKKIGREIFQCELVFIFL